jgi:GntR family transcriptional regulator, rspAB operon transcriptional repressor
LMRLEEEGLVEVFPQYATVVSRIDIALAQQAHFLRQALELEIVKALALQPSEQLVGELNSTISLQQKFAKAGDFEKFMSADNDFHRQLYAATGNQGLWDLVRSRSGHIDRLRRLHLPSPGKAQDIVRHHKLIVTAISARQPDDAQRHLRKHLSGTLGYLAEIRARFPEYLSG